MYRSPASISTQTKLVESLGENPLAKLDKNKPNRAAQTMKRKGTRRGSVAGGDDTPETELLENALLKITELLQIGTSREDGRGRVGGESMGGGRRLRPPLREALDSRLCSCVVWWFLVCARLRCGRCGDHRQEYESGWWRHQGCADQRYGVQHHHASLS